MRHPVRSITKRRCDLFKEGSRDAGEVKEGQSFAHKSNNGVIFHAGFVSPSELFARPSLYPGHIRGWPQNKYINFTPLPPPILHSSHISASILIHTSPLPSVSALFRESYLRVYAYTYHSSIRVVTTHPRGYTGTHTGRRSSYHLHQREHTYELPRTHRGRRIRAHVPTRVLRHISKRGAECMRRGEGTGRGWCVVTMETPSPSLIIIWGKMARGLLPRVTPPPHSLHSSPLPPIVRPLFLATLFSTLASPSLAPSLHFLLLSPAFYSPSAFPFSTVPFST